MKPILSEPAPQMFSSSLHHLLPDQLSVYALMGRFVDFSCLTPPLCLKGRRMPNPFLPLLDRL